MREICYILKVNFVRFLGTKENIITKRGGTQEMNLYNI